MKRVINCVSAAALSLAAFSSQAAEISANVALTSDYKFRGISQTDTSPAIQGGFDVNFENGVYVGTWGSNVDFANSLELDYYIGYSTDLNEDVSIDVGYLYYDYPGTPDVDDYAEVYGSVSFKDFTLGVNYSDDYYLETGKLIYIYGGYEFALPEDFSVAIHYGFSDLDRSTQNAAPGENAFLTGGADSYADYNITLNKSYGGVDFSLGYYDTDLNKAECFDNDSLCDGSFIFTIAKSL
ncbi:TorF family putative porin [uncultured Pseudoteredinibacter sp.]|uniref:TorF family putative porin n=1 Tax=uncultured Pseudoteredinibacter sp. TaxID=1641701 RepID=UPI0026343D9C|nr:TorF family putative porin [uncultured Pseudoteredinibacter sp.]